LTDITEDRLAKDWTLSEQDKDFILKNFRGNTQKMRYAIQLCNLRYSGNFITDRSKLSLKVVNYLSRQLDLDSLLETPDLAFKDADYPRLQKVQDHLSFKNFDCDEKENLKAWLLKKTQEHIFDKKELTSKTREYLRLRRIILPSHSRLGRLIASSIKEAHIGLYRQITERYPKGDLPKLDALLTSIESTSYSELMHFKQPPPIANAKALNQLLSYLEVLEELKVQECNLSDINPKVLETLAQLAKDQSSWDLRRIRPNEKRYAIVICFLVESAKTILDTIIDMHSLLLGDIERKSKNEFNHQRAFMVRDAKSSRKKTLSFIKSALAVEDPTKITLADYLATFDRRELQDAVEKTEAYEDFEEEGAIKNIVKRFSYLRKYSKNMMKLNFEASSGNKSLLAAINILRLYHASEGKVFPPNPPINFLPKSWRNNLYDEKGKLLRQYWEMGVYYAMKSSLSKGDLYITDSRHHRYFWHVVYKPEDWEKEKEDSYKNLALPKEFENIQCSLKKDFNQVTKMFQENFGKDGFAQIVDNKMKLCKEDALDIPPEVKQLKKQLGAAIPLVRIEKLIAEVDKLSGFSRAFQPTQKNVELVVPKKPLYGVITAQATNIGLYAMGQCNYGITASVLRDTSERYVTPGTIHDANAILIQCHRSYPISRVHGEGRYSSSDGQRFAIEASFMKAAYYPRYYGYYEKAISVYTHISDQYSVFNTKVISCSAREATYVLDGLLLNNTEINPEFHCTDTHGYTDHIFALCYLLGFSFQPRLKDIPHQALYKMDKKDRYEIIDNLFTGAADMQLVKDEWDTIVRVVASLKNGLAPAHVIIQRLANRGDKVAKALQALGRVIKTIYILRYVCDAELRRHVHLQLNRGESRHSLAKVIFFDNRGVFKTSDYEEIMNKASCLSLVSNAVLVWNTHHIQQTVDRMRREGYKVEDDVLARISPLSLKNIITHGMYDFVEVG
jgi:TnpA family transposase